LNLTELEIENWNCKRVEEKEGEMKDFKLEEQTSKLEAPTKSILHPAPFHVNVNTQRSSPQF
jgi:hypothetical protein